MFSERNPFNNLLKTFVLDGVEYKYYNVTALGDSYNKLPYSIRVLLESAVRNCDNFQVYMATH